MSFTASITPEQSETVRILHVDDEPDLADLTATFLTREDERFEVNTATSAADGLELFARHEFDCIISDYDMPGQTGIEFLKAIRKDDDELPFILYTGKGSEEVASDAISAGVTDYLQKQSGSDQYKLLANRVANAVEQYRTRQGMEHTRRRFRTLVEEATDAILIVEPDGTLSYATPSAETILGRPPEELVGTNGFDPVHPDDCEHVMAEFASLVEDPDNRRTVEFRYQQPDGSHIWAEARGRNLQNEPLIDGVVVYVRDITDRKKRELELQRQERRYQAVFNDPNILVGLIDTDGSVRDINQTAMEYIDAPLDEMTGKPFWETPWFDHSETVVKEVKDWIERAATGEYVEFEVDLVRPDGEPYTVEGVFRPVTNEDGEVVSLLISDRDITEQKQREKELETVQRRFEAVLENTTTPMFMKDDEGRYLFVNRGYRDLFGFEDADIVGHTDAELHPPEMAAKVQKNDRDVLDRGEALETEERITVNANERIFLSTKVPIYDTGDRSDPEDPVAVLGVATDITELKNRKRELQQEHERFRALFEKAFDAMLIADDDGEYIDANQSATELLGLSEDELLGRSIDEFAPEDFDFEVAWREFQESDTERGTFPLVRADGSERIVEYAATTNVVPGQHLSVLRDITDQRQFEQQLKEEQQFVQSIFDALPDPLYAFDTDGYLLRWNEELEAVTGYAKDEIAEMYVTEFVPEDETETIATEFQHILSDRESVTVESAFETRAGDRIPYEFTGGPLIDADGRLRGVTGIGRDLSARKKQEERLKALNTVSHDLMTVKSREEVAEIGVNAAAKIVGLDASAIHLYDGEKEGLVPVTWTDAIIDLVGDLPLFTPGDSIAWRVYEQGEPLAVDDVHADPDVQNPDTPVESELYIPLGKYGMLITGSGVPNAFDQQDLVFAEILGGAITSALEQVEQTDQLRAREQELKRQNDRLEQFASVVSHDLRNPLTVAQGRLDLAREECDSEHLDAVGRAHERMGALIDDLLMLARHGEEISDIEPVGLATITETCWQNAATAEATLRIDVDRSIQADRSRLQQLIENLFRNAVEHGGKNVAVTVGELDSGFYVEDDGPGIPEEKRSDVFEAGYSTAEDGTGFGLSIVKQVSDAHGWDVCVIEGSDGGTRFEITGVEYTAE